MLLDEFLTILKKYLNNNKPLHSITFLKRGSHYFSSSVCFLFVFRDVLNFLRSGDLPPRERVRSVYKEAQYYSIGPLLDSLEELQPLKGEKVRQAFLGLMPYYKGKLRM